MKYENYNKQEIQECLNAYLTFDKEVFPYRFRSTGITKDSEDYNADKYLEFYHKSTTFKKSRKDFVKILLEYKNSKNISTEAIETINKLIGDRKLYNKIVFCTDGSYRNNRIWANLDKSNKVINFYPDVNYKLNKQVSFTSLIENLNIKKQIDWIYNHFDVVFLQIPNLSCFEHDVKFGIEDDYYNGADYDYEEFMEKEPESLDYKDYGFEDFDPESQEPKLGCKDCPDDECNGHCCSCAYRPL